MNWSELSIFVSAVDGCVVSVIIATQKSKCTKITFGCGCCECERTVDTAVEADKLEKELEDVCEEMRDDVKVSVKSVKGVKV